MLSNRDYRSLAMAYVEQALRSFEGRKFVLFDYNDKIYGGLVLDCGDFNGVRLWKIDKIRMPINDRKLVEDIVRFVDDVQRVLVDNSISFDKGVFFQGHFFDGRLSYLTLEERLFLESNNSTN